MSSVRIGRDDFNASQHHPTYDEHDHHDLSHLRHVPTLPIPDLRFEYTYLKNIRPHVQVEHSEEAATVVDEKSGAAQETVLSREVVRVAWGNILWVTTKEQVISPLVQGVLWGVIRWSLLPGAVGLGQSLQTWWKNGDTLAAKRRGGKQTIDGVRNIFFGRPS